MAEKNISLPVIALDGESKGTIEVSGAVFGIEDENPQVVHDAVVTYLANRRQATAKTKKRHEVHGTNKKPWRQKGTGRARAGDVKSPIWVGGGIVFGPDGNQNYKRSQNKKAHKLALRTVWSEKVRKGLIVVEDTKVEKISTKEFVKTLSAIKAEGKILIVVDGTDDNLILSARNIANVGLTEVNNVAVYDLLHFDTVVISKDNIKKIEEALK
ncbi:MAG: 50S ribosomal protein L4 [Candidatus Enteromonas sp.]|nr:50S ribosomal protein L4 [bacterium]MDD6917813.1 50S ribosomal protein L4 [bacterium]MDY6100723.1 50S ribosomal protein L4 [Candidatus Enteromonas sp.]